MNYNVAQKKVIITGGSQGLGLELAKGFLEAGASVAICGRDTEMLKKAKSQLNSHIKAGESLVAEVADISKPSDVEAFTQNVLKSFNSKIDVLINNAGVYGPKGFSESIDWEEWRAAIEINFFGSVLMAHAVIPAMKRQHSGKIIQLSGGGAAQPMPRFTAYASSKAAIVRFCDSLALELKPWNIDVNSIAAGALNTRFLEEVLAAGPDVVGKDFYERSVKQQETGGAPMQRSVELSMFLASNDSDGVTAKLISALWDKWEDFPKHIEELNSSDIYSIRRVVGKDRGMSWGDK